MPLAKVNNICTIIVIILFWKSEEVLLILVIFLDMLFQL